MSGLPLSVTNGLIPRYYPLRSHIKYTSEQPLHGENEGIIYTPTLFSYLANICPISCQIPHTTGVHICGIKWSPTASHFQMIEKFQGGRQEVYSVVMRQGTVEFQMCEVIKLCSYDHSKREVRLRGSINEI